MNIQEQKVVGLWRVVVVDGMYEEATEEVFCVKAEDEDHAWNIFIQYWEDSVEFDTFLRSPVLFFVGTEDECLYDYYIPKTYLEWKVKYDYCEDKQEAFNEIQKLITEAKTDNGAGEWYRHNKARKVTIEPQTIITSL